MNDLYKAFTKFFTPAGVEPPGTDPGGVKTCAWHDCTNLITTDDPGLDFCGHTCQRKWTCETNGIEYTDENDAQRRAWQRILR